MGAQEVEPGWPWGWPTDSRDMNTELLFSSSPKLKSKETARSWGLSAFVLQAEQTLFRHEGSMSRVDGRESIWKATSLMDSLIHKVWINLPKDVV